MDLPYKPRNSLKKRRDDALDQSAFCFGVGQLKGDRSNPSDWTSLITTSVSHITRPGYTMHEHLDDLTFKNINGRVYDPQIARFLSPDPQLQAPGYWLNYNRYGYCFLSMEYLGGVQVSFMHAAENEGNPIYRGNWD